MEMVFWESVRGSSDPADFRAYLEQYPNGRFAPLARNRIAALTPKTAAPVPAAPAPATTPAASAAPVVAVQIAPGAGSNRLPRQGDTWVYRLSEPTRTDGPKQRDYTVKVFAASPDAISEQYAVDGGASGEWTHRGERMLVPVGKVVFAPFLLAFGELPPAGSLGRLQIAERACGAAYLCQVSGRVLGRETVRVPAGSFETIKVSVEHSWRPASVSSAFQGAAAQMNGSRTLIVWYAPAVKRAVKFSSRPSFGDFPDADTNFDLELVSVKLN